METLVGMVGVVGAAGVCGFRTKRAQLLKELAPSSAGCASVAARSPSTRPSNHALRVDKLKSRSNLHPYNYQTGGTTGSSKYYYGRNTRSVGPNDHGLKRSSCATDSFDDDCDVLLFPGVHQNEPHEILERGRGGSKSSNIGINKTVQLQTQTPVTRNEKTAEHFSQESPAGRERGLTLEDVRVSAVLTKQEIAYCFLTPAAFLAGFFSLVFFSFRRVAGAQSLEDMKKEWRMFCAYNKSNRAASPMSSPSASV